MSPRGMKKRSVVWNYFQQLPNGKEAKCNLCNKVIKRFDGTSNLKQHILRIHPTQNLEPDTTSILTFLTFQDVDVVPEAGPSATIKATSSKSKLTRKRPARKLTLSGSNTNNNNKELSDLDISKIDSVLLNMITKDLQPVSIVENEAFLEYTRLLQPLYKPPSRKKLSTDILPKHYAEAVTRLRLILKEVNHCAITTDIWTWDSNKTFLTITIHYIHKDFLNTNVLSTEEIVGAHTEENIANTLMSVLNEWDVLKKVVICVSDNGTNIRKAINDHLKKHHHPCVAHMLNLSVQEAIDSNSELSVILKKCRNLVGYFKHSVVANEKLKSIQEQMGQTTLKIKQDVPTRWNSCYIMITRLLQIKDLLCAIVSTLPKAPIFLNAEEWEVLGECAAVLKPANDLTTILSAEKYPTISLIIPLIRGFQYSLNNVAIINETAETLRIKLIETVTRRFGNCEKDTVIAKACFLDPRFKKIGFGNQENANNVEKWITEELTAVLLNRSGTSEQINQQTSTSDFNIWCHFDEKVSSTVSTTSPTSIVLLTLRQYLEMPLLDRQKNPLEFWKKHKHLMPELYEISIKYLCIPSTSVPSDTVFSKAGQITNLRRNRLEPKTLDYIIFLNAM